MAGKSIKGAKRDFSSDRDIINFKPRISFVEPPQIEGEPPTAKPEPLTIDEVQRGIQELIDAYRRVEQIADITQARVDQRAKNLEINLDPLVDAPTIDSIKRAFPDKKDPTKITFDDYRHCLGELNSHAENNVPTLSQEDLDKALSDKLKTDFGGLGKPSGLNRPELDSASQIIKPINIPEFQKEAVEGTFNLMKPLITSLIKKLVKPF